MGMCEKSQKIVQSQLRRRLLKAVSELGLHYLLCCINATVVEKGLSNSSE